MPRHCSALKALSGTTVPETAAGAEILVAVWVSSRLGNKTLTIFSIILKGSPNGNVRSYAIRYWERTFPAPAIQHICGESQAPSSALLWLLRYIQSRMAIKEPPGSNNSMAA
jgi:hypothetical protein